jgi:hypothetical protein
MPLAIVLAATWIHNIGFILFVLAFLAHMAAIALKPNRPMIHGIFTGSIAYDYAKHRHPLWLADMESAQTSKTAEEQTPLPELLDIVEEADADPCAQPGKEPANQD